jgi:crossover junction endodeoxyribonuclease RuvC
MPIVGIDPGVSGGIVCLWENDRLEAWKIPETERDIFDLLEGCSNPADNFIPVVFLEFVRSSPQQGVVSSFTFGRGYGFLRGIITALKYPLHDVTPQKWQKALGCLTHGDKNVSKQRAQQLYPHLKITHATADALLIATYGRMVMNNEIELAKVHELAQKIL